MDNIQHACVSAVIRRLPELIFSSPGTSVDLAVYVYRLLIKSISRGIHEFGV